MAQHIVLGSKSLQWVPSTWGTWSEVPALDSRGSSAARSECQGSPAHGGLTQASCLHAATLGPQPCLTFPWKAAFTAPC